MRNYTLLLSCFLFCFTTLSAQVPFQGVVTTQVLPIKKAHLNETVHLLYHNSFDGNLKVYLNNKLVLDKEVNKGDEKKLALGGSIAKSQVAIMKIVLNDLFYQETVVHFHHPFIRINYLEEDRHLSIHMEDAIPSVEQIEQEQVKKQIDLVLSRRMAGLR